MKLRFSTLVLLQPHYNLDIMNRIHMATLVGLVRIVLVKEAYIYRPSCRVYSWLRELSQLKE